MATTAELQVRDKVYIGGEWVQSSASETIEVINSTTEEVIGTIPAGTAADADRAVGTAREAFELVSDLAQGAGRVASRRSPPGSASAARRSPRRSPRSWGCRSSSAR